MVATNTKTSHSYEPARPEKVEALRSILVKTIGSIKPAQPSPEDSLGELFAAVQKSGLFEDPQTFIDLVPRRKLRLIKQEYELKKKDPNFNLEEFTRHNFFSITNEDNYLTNNNHSPREHIQELWDVLSRKYQKDSGSLIALPYKYVVPGGRFASQFYWDSYFIMIGLLADGRLDLAENMLKNASFMLRRFGKIPNGNRTYFLSRSHPPFFSHMVKLVAGYKKRSLTLVEYLPYMLAEYRFWMKTDKSLFEENNDPAFQRVVRMPDGSLLSRYFDNKMTPRPEQLHRDQSTAAKHQHEKEQEKLYLDLRAGAESGWDFSSRWFQKSDDISTIHTTDIVPVDLNSLLYHLELTIAETYSILRQPILERKFLRLANQRKAAVRKYLWDEKQKYFVDYDYKTGKRTGKVTLAAAFPLFVKIATPVQARAVAKRIEKDFLKQGGLVTTLEDNGQQWDYPNGWAPLQWVAIQGLRAYGFHELAQKIKKRWIKTCVDMFNEQGKMVEKYNVIQPGRPGAGGEYSLQDGFGWTNGVLAALLDEEEK